MNNEEIEVLEDNNIEKLSNGLEQKPKKKKIIIIMLLLLLIIGFVLYILYYNGIIFNNKTNENVNVSGGYDNNQNINTTDELNKDNDYVTIKVTNYEEDIIKILKENNILYDKSKDFKVILDYGKLNDIDFKIKISSYDSHQSIDIIVNDSDINYYSGATKGYAFAEFADAVWEFTSNEIYDTKIYIKLYDDKIALVYDSSTYFLSDRHLNARINIYNQNGLVSEIKDLVIQYYLNFNDNDMKRCDIVFNNDEIQYCQLVGEDSGMHKINIMKYKNGVSTIVDNFYGVANENI